MTRRDGPDRSVCVRLLAVVDEMRPQERQRLSLQHPMNDRAPGSSDLNVESHYERTYLHTSEVPSSVFLWIVSPKTPRRVHYNGLARNEQCSASNQRMTRARSGRSGSTWWSSGCRS